MSKHKLATLLAAAALSARAATYYTDNDPFSVPVPFDPCPDCPRVVNDDGSFTVASGLTASSYRGPFAMNTSLSPGPAEELDVRALTTNAWPSSFEVRGWWGAYAWDFTNGTPTSPGDTLEVYYTNTGPFTALLYTMSGEFTNYDDFTPTNVLVQMPSNCNHLVVVPYCVWPLYAPELPVLNLNVTADYSAQPSPAPTPDPWPYYWVTTNAVSPWATNLMAIFTPHAYAALTPEQLSCTNYLTKAPCRTHICAGCGYVSVGYMSLRTITLQVTPRIVSMVGRNYGTTNLIPPVSNSPPVTVGPNYGGVGFWDTANNPIWTPFTNRSITVNANQMNLNNTCIGVAFRYPDAVSGCIYYGTSRPGVDVTATLVYSNQFAVDTLTVPAHYELLDVGACASVVDLWLNVSCDTSNSPCSASVGSSGMNMFYCSQEGGREGPILEVTTNEWPANLIQTMSGARYKVRGMMNGAQVQVQSADSPNATIWNTETNFFLDQDGIGEVFLESATNYTHRYYRGLLTPQN
jgi:hypothetical protein